MALKGDLASVDLAQVFQMLALNQKVGMLCITSPRGWRALYFEPRGFCPYFDEHVLLDKVVGRATRTGHIDPEVVREARLHAVATGAGLADALIEAGHLTDAELVSMLRSEMEEEIYELFSWDQATFEFLEGARSIEGRDGHVDSRFVFATDMLIMEAARRIDEWSFIEDRIESPRELFRVAGNAQPDEELEEVALAVFDLVDGKRNVTRLIELTGMPPFLVHKGLAVLLDEGLIEAVPAGALPETAAECEADGRAEDAVHVYERAIELGVGLPDAHEQAAALYEGLQEFEKACGHHKQLAELAAENGDVRRAVDLFSRVVEMLPTDLAARERLVELTVGRADLASRGFDPVSHGKELVDLYLAVGEVDRVRGVLERLLRDNPYDIELKKSLINVHTKAGDSRRVVELYESIAEDLVQARKPIEAIKYLQKILMLDRNRKDIAERIRSLYVLDERRRSRRRSLVWTAVAAVVIAVLGTGWWFYDQNARDELGLVHVRAQERVDTEDYAGALEEYRTFAAGFPLTTALRDVEAEVSRIESLELRSEQQLALERRKHAEHLARVRAGYRSAWETVPKLIAAEDLDGALRRCEEVRASIDTDGEAEDAAWAEEVGLNAELQGLRTYVAAAFDLDRRARSALRDGDWREARSILLEAVDSYGLSATVRAARVPIEVRTRPAGAEVYVDGEPVLDAETGRVLRTPCVVELGHSEREDVEVRLAGFVPARVGVDVREREVVEALLEAVPASVMEFAEPVRGAPSVHRGHLAAGLRGGQIALLRLEDERRSVHQLPGLDEVDGGVALTHAVAVFATREGRLVGLSLTRGEQLWSERLTARPVHDVLVHANRVLFVDERGRFVAYDAAKGGDPLWFVPSVGRTVGVPVVEGRFAYVGSEDGQVLVIDAIEGGIAERVRVGRGLTCGVIEADGTIVAGTDTGRLVAIRPGAAAPVWELQLPNGALAEQIVRAGHSVLVRTHDHRLLAVDLREGSLQAEVGVAGRITAGPLVRSGGGGDLEAVVVTREEGVDHDVLRAFSAAGLEPAWFFQDGGEFAGDPATLGQDLFLPGSSGEVLRFR
jgi:tetratricopeptide (TPR) repeat protein/outer membrane protein assembly factor BamB